MRLTVLNRSASVKDVAEVAGDRGGSFLNPDLRNLRLVCPRRTQEAADDPFLSALRTPRFSALSADVGPRRAQEAAEDPFWYCELHDLGVLRGSLSADCAGDRRRILAGFRSRAISPCSSAEIAAESFLDSDLRNFRMSVRGERRRPRRIPAGLLKPPTISEFAAVERQVY